MQNATVTAEICSKMVESATRSCQPIIAMPPEQSNPNWDAMATSFASLSSAFAWGSLILAVIAIVAGLAWGKIVTATAEREAKRMAKDCADDYINTWLAEKAPGIIRERVDLILDATLGSGNDAKAADDLGKEAG